VHRPPRPAATTIAAATPVQPLEAHGGMQQRPPEEMCPSGPREGGICNILEEDDEDTHVPMHTFLVPVRVPCFLLDSSFVTSAIDSLTGIATSSRVIDTGQELLGRVHLKSGHSLEINVGCLEIILPGPEGSRAHGGPRRAEVENQELQTHGCYSSCEEETDHEGDEWPTEMLHNPDFYNFSWTSPGTVGCTEEADTDSEIERAAEYLQGEGICSRQDGTQKGRGTMALRGRLQGHVGRRGRQRSTGGADVNVDSPHANMGGGAADGTGGGSVDPDPTPPDHVHPDTADRASLGLGEGGPGPSARGQGQATGGVGEGSRGQGDQTQGRV
jgi:hypothetical protein